MNEVWTYKYKDKEIKVTNGNYCTLALDGELKVKKFGLLCCNLRCVLDSGEKVRAFIGGFWQIDCELIVDDYLLQPVKLHRPGR